MGFCEVWSDVCAVTKLQFWSEQSKDQAALVLTTIAQAFRERAVKAGGGGGSYIGELDYNIFQQGQKDTYQLGSCKSPVYRK